MSAEREHRPRRLGVSATVPTVIDGCGVGAPERQTSQLPLEAPAEPEPSGPVAPGGDSLPDALSLGDTSIVSEEELGTANPSGFGAPVATGPGPAAAPAPRPGRSRAWIALLLAGLLGLGAGAAAGIWLPREVVVPQVVSMASSESVDHHGWTIRLISQRRQRGDQGTHLLLHLGVRRQRGSAAEVGRYFLLDVGPVTRVPAFWSSSADGELKIAFPLLGKQKAGAGLRFWPPGTPPLLMRLRIKGKK